ncbi:nitrilotriacetate monooxygenase family FMN-dependent oxidoreductase [Sorangium cellulosum]|uniref:Nitrilotriacetate monooxygenase family FMN-dependent oxidoreductase n=1 Tax=Sorangium cellulosum TaxID=56 RepID=A0A2L0EM68_SORCE|nr:LLM class flavin-dependent oxidoreductase [Sorangium cellulosum]AUX40394.1 nitrilotriacetate monooxygenase family FMN-dependent oxidoreductase [Sorangium cellulosum]
MSHKKRQMKLGAFLMATGHHVAAWRHPAAQADAGLNFKHYKQIVQAAERAKFDMMFLADSAAVWDRSLESLSRSSVVHFEPITLLSALAAVTERIGLVATVTTTYNEPFHVARKFASLDYLSGGRAGWNLVTSANAAEALNFSRDHHLEHALRYRRAREFAEVVTSLWDSWDDDVFVRSKESGVFFVPDRLHVPDHRGEHFVVRGPLNVVRPPQGYPVMVQAGSSEPGQELAAETAEVIFTAQQTLDDAQVFYRSVKGRLDRYGRSPDHLKIMPGIFPVVGRTEQEAQDRYARIAGARGHWQLVGTPERIADQLEQWFVEGAADGFNVMPPHLPGGLTDFIDLVIPELRRRGLFRAEYEGRTLRENLGLPRPANKLRTGERQRPGKAEPAAAASAPLRPAASA